MSPLPKRLAWISLLSLAALSTGHAESLASSASSAGSASVGSLSDSITGSSDASSPDREVAEGDYRIVDVAALTERPGVLRLRLQATANADRVFFLALPRAALPAAGLAVGDVIRAQQRPYGLAFARTDAPEPFFLVLADDWHGELDPRPLTL